LFPFCSRQNDDIFGRNRDNISTISCNYYGAAPVFAFLPESHQKESLPACADGKQVSDGIFMNSVIQHVLEFILNKIPKKAI